MTILEESSSHRFERLTDPLCIRTISMQKAIPYTFGTAEVRLTTCGTATINCTMPFYAAAHSYMDRRDTNRGHVVFDKLANMELWADVKAGRVVVGEGRKNAPKNRGQRALTMPKMIGRSLSGQRMNQGSRVLLRCRRMRKK